MVKLWMETGFPIDFTRNGADSAGDPGATVEVLALFVLQASPVNRNPATWRRLSGGVSECWLVGGLVRWLVGRF